MDIRSNATSGLAVVRVAMVMFGLGALWWAAGSIAVLSDTRRASEFAAQIIGGGTFNDATLAHAVSSFGSRSASQFESASYIRSAAIVRLRYFESAIATAEPAAIDERITSFMTSVRASFLVEPSESFLWFALFWLENNYNGYIPANLKYLERSYELGPREQWIAERRNRRALTAFSGLNRATQEMVVAEYAGMVSGNLISEAASILVGAGWPVREQLLDGLSHVDTARKIALTRFLSRKGYRIEIPGLPPSDERPWR